MFPETAAPLFSQAVLLKGWSRLSAHGGARRHFTASRCVAGKASPARLPWHIVDIPGLDKVTYADKMHLVPGLTKPVSPPWERDYKDPRFYRSPPVEQMPLYKERPCYVFNQRTSVLEGKSRTVSQCKLCVV